MFVFMSDRREDFSENPGKIETH